MEPLEDVLRKVEELSKDLYAEIPEEGHYETVRESLPKGLRGDEGRHENPSDYEHEEWIVDRPTEPNTKAREVARTQLQEIYDSSNIYSARFYAGQSLMHHGSKEWFEIVRSWIDNLRSQVGNVKQGTPQNNFSLMDATELFNGCSNSVAGTQFLGELLQNEDIKNFRIGIRKALKNRYRQSKYADHRLAAGKSLDYSHLRIWSHEHPIVATLTGIASVGTVTGLGYLVYEYLSK